MNFADAMEATLVDVEDDTDEYRFEDAYDLSNHDRVIFQVDGGSVCDPCVMESFDMNDKPCHKGGAASYEISEVGLFSCTLSDMFPIPNKHGYFVVDVEGSYSTDSWTGEGDSDFYAGNMRAATYKEVRDYYGGKRWQIIQDIIASHVFLWNKKNHP